MKREQLGHTGQSAAAPEERSRKVRSQRAAYAVVES